MKKLPSCCLCLQWLSWPQWPEVERDWASWKASNALVSFFLLPTSKGSAACNDLFQPDQPDVPSPRMSFEEQIFLFNREFGRDNAVTVLNTSVFPLSDQLGVWDTDFGMSL